MDSVAMTQDRERLQGVRRNHVQDRGVWSGTSFQLWLLKDNTQYSFDLVDLHLITRVPVVSGNHLPGPDLEIRRLQVGESDRQ